MKKIKKNVTSKAAALFVAILLIGGMSLAPVSALDLAPDNVSAESQGTSSIELHWDQVYGADSYIIFRAISPYGPFNLVATTPMREFVDTGLQSNTGYYYQIRAYSFASGEGPDSAMVYARTQMETFTVRATSGPGGSTNPSGTTSVYLGESIAVTFQPEEDYEVDQVYVDDEPLPEGFNTEGYIFGDIWRDHTIHVTFKEVSVEPSESDETSESSEPQDPAETEESEIKTSGSDTGKDTVPSSRRPKPSGAVSTSDPFNIGLYIGLAVIAAVIIIWIARKYKRNQ